MNNAENVSVGKPAVAGAVFRAPVGTTLPTDATTALDAAFKNVGFISTDGVENEDNVETESYRAWGGVVVITYQTEKTDDFSFSMIEALNTEALKAYYGDSNVTGDLTNGITVEANAEDLPESSWVIEQVLRGGTLKRIVIPDAMVAEKGTITYKDDEVIAYPLRLSGNADASGNTHYEYIKGA